MRILQVMNFYQNTSGEDIYFSSLAELLRKYGNEVYTYTKNSKEISEGLCGKFQVGIGMFFNKKVIDEFSELLDKFKPDIAHFHNLYPLITPIAYEICKKKGVPIIQTIHNYRFMCPKGILFRNGKICELCVGKKFPYLLLLYGCYHRSYLASIAYSSSVYYYQLKNAFDKIDKFIFLTDFTRNYYIKHLNFVESKTTVIPYFFDNPPLNKEKLRKGNYFLYIGRLVEEKGIISLLKLFSAIPKLKLVIIGDGPLKREVLEYRQYKNISIKDYLPREEALVYIKKALFTIFPSLWYDALPLSMIESYALGTPVLAPKFGPFLELVKERETGLFFKYDDLEDLRAKLILINQKKGLISKMSIYARKEYESKYLPERHYSSLMKVYHSVIK